MQSKNDWIRKNICYPEVAQSVKVMWLHFSWCDTVWKTHFHCQANSRRHLWQLTQLRQILLADRLHIQTSEDKIKYRKVELTFFHLGKKLVCQQYNAADVYQQSVWNFINYFNIILFTNPLWLITFNKLIQLQVFSAFSTVHEKFIKHYLKQIIWNETQLYLDFDVYLLEFHNHQQSQI